KRPNLLLGWACRSPLSYVDPLCAQIRPPPSRDLIAAQGHAGATLAFQVPEDELRDVVAVVQSLRKEIVEERRCRCQLIAVEHSGVQTPTVDDSLHRTGPSSRVLARPRPGPKAALWAKNVSKIFATY